MIAVEGKDNCLLRVTLRDSVTNTRGEAGVLHLADKRTVELVHFLEPDLPAEPGELFVEAGFDETDGLNGHSTLGIRSGWLTGTCRL